jgi:hypothetical protein
MAQQRDNPYQAPRESTNGYGSPFPQHARWALIYAVGGNVAEIAVWCLLFRHHAGEAVRPMDLSCFGFLIVICTLILVWPLAVATFRSGHVLWGAIALVLSFTPFFVGALTMNVVAYVLNLEFKP